MEKGLKSILKEEFGYLPGINQLREIERLVFEIAKRQDLRQDRLIKGLKTEFKGKNVYGKGNFFLLKKILIGLRFPISCRQQKIKPEEVFLPEISKAIDGNFRVKKRFLPLEIYVEKNSKKTALAQRVIKKFPKVPVYELKSVKEYLKKNRFTPAQLKKPVIFIVKEKWDFIKPCPCTEGHLRCGYWILNLGFGCPFDCSYCFLQHYSNFPGISLPANLEDFFEQFDDFSKKLKKPIRIGTGEFCDSLALDHITEYSKELIPYFKNKNALFELKTKSQNIENLLKTKPGPGTIISWSLSPQRLIKTEEQGASSLRERLQAAAKCQRAGYGVAFHFDPVIFYAGWEKEYKKVIETLYAACKPPFAWISLGTLRCHRSLKIISESRFPESKIFYGELLIGEDKKLRYPKFMRRKIYQTMRSHISKYDLKTPVYLCMENADIWQDFIKTPSAGRIEKYLIKK